MWVIGNRSAAGGPFPRPGTGR